jgi:hypothetical protein
VISTKLDEIQFISRRAVHARIQKLHLKSGKRFPLNVQVLP